MYRRGRRQKDGGRKRGAEGLGTAASLLKGTRARDGGGRQNRGKTGLTTQENECEKGKLRLRENRRSSPPRSAPPGDLRSTERQDLETLDERNKLATKAVRIRGRSRPTLQHSGVPRKQAKQGTRYWGVDPWSPALGLRALAGAAQSSATFNSRARGSSNPVRIAVR